MGGSDCPGFRGVSDPFLFQKKLKGGLERFKSGALSKTAIYAPRFGCLVQKALGDEIVCA